MSANVSSKGHARPAVVRRPCWLRWFALLVALLGLFAQQRVLTPSLHSSPAVVRQIAEREQGIETDALRAQPALRVAAAPVFARVPSFPDFFVAWPRPRVQAEPPPALAGPAYASISHFHSKRRIPRMNSEEPPRA